MKNINLLEKLKAETIVICGSAPSLKNFDPEMLNECDSIRFIALNNAFLYERVTFDAVIAADYTAISKNTEVLKNEGLIKLFGIANGPTECIIPGSMLEYGNVVSFDIFDSIDNKSLIPANEFVPTIADSPLRFVKSIALTAMQVALWLRPKRIYLVGLDFSQGGHFNDDTNDIEYMARHKAWTDAHWERNGVREQWKELRAFAQSNYSETEIISVNPMALRGIFKDVYMDCNVPKVTGYIGVKEHSTRLPGKNILPFGKTNLLSNKIHQMQRSLNIESIIVSTDSNEMLRIAESEGVKGIRRPVEYANETRPYQEFVRYLTDVLPGEHIMRCPVTAPLCDADTLNDSIVKYFYALNNGYDSLTSVLKFQHHILDEQGPLNFTTDVNHKGSQNLPVWYEIANCMDIVPMDVMRKCLFQFGPHFFRYEVDKISAIDIDDKMDYEIACALQKHLNTEN